MEIGAVHSESEVLRCLKIGRAFTIANSARTLDLCGEYLGEKAIKRLSEAIKESNSLERLNLYDNDIGSGGCVWLSKALSVNTSLQSLNINKCYIGTEGCRLLSKALKENQTLTELQLYHNQIYSEGCKWLSEALKVNTTLKRIDLRRNMIGMQGASCIIEALKINRTLTELNFVTEPQNPDLEPEVLSVIERMLEYNKCYPKNAIMDTIIFFINFARCEREALSLLPLEMWRLIFKQLKYAQYEHFEILFDQVYNNIGHINTIIRNKKKLRLVIRSDSVEMTL